MRLLRRAITHVRDLWLANLEVASEWRADRDRLIRFVALTWIVDGLVLALLAAWLAPIRIVGVPALVATVVLISFANAVIRPLVVRFLIRFAVLTFGLLTIVINALMVGLVAALLPGFEVGSFGVALLIAVVLGIVNLALGWLLDLDFADTYYRQVVLRLVRKRSPHGEERGPGVVIVQIDGLSQELLRFAIRTGSAPNLSRWVRAGTHRLVGWEVLLPSQTSASQAGILHGNNDDIPAFRWYEKATRTLIVSNRPSDAAEIERRVSDGRGLLADGGSSVSNLVSGDAPRNVLTNSRLREPGGVAGRDFYGFFADPATVFRTVALGIVELIREANESRRQRLRGVEPRIRRGWPYPLLRAGACVALRDLAVGVVLEDMYRGAPVIYVDLVGYDEIAHHAGPERPEAIDQLTEVDRQIGLLAKSAPRAARDYRFVILSDHGQSQGATFLQRYGEPLEALIRSLLSGEPEVIAATSNVEGWGHVNTVLTQLASGESRRARVARRGMRRRMAEGEVRLGPDRPVAFAGGRSAPEAAAADPGDESEVVVCASGNLAGVYLTVRPERLTLEDLEELHPGLVPALASHPGIGLVLVRSRERGAVVFGRAGVRGLDDDRLDGEDPLAPFGNRAGDSLRRLDRFATCGDLMLVSMVDPDTGEVAAFEELVGSHGGLGGPQTDAFLLYPADLAPPPLPIIGAPAVFRVLVRWLEELGLRGSPEPERERRDAAPAERAADGAAERAATTA